MSLRVRRTPFGVVVGEALHTMPPVMHAGGERRTCEGRNARTAEGLSDLVQASSRQVVGGSFGSHLQEHQWWGPCHEGAPSTAWNSVMLSISADSDFETSATITGRVRRSGPRITYTKGEQV